MHGRSRAEIRLRSGELRGQDISSAVLAIQSESFCLVISWASPEGGGDSTDIYLAGVDLYAKMARFYRV
jgi:hypothetical protein